MDRFSIFVTLAIISACSPGETTITTAITTGNPATATDSSDATSDDVTTGEPTTSAGSTTTDTTDATTTEGSTYGSDATDSSSSSTGEPPPGACGSPGSLFGPCIDGLGCLGNFGCFSRKEGQVCIPTFTYAATHTEEIDACVRQIGGNIVCGSKDIIEGWCVVACNSECAPGLNCDQGDVQIVGDNVCVHPW